MDKIVVRGGARLQGRVAVEGAKNAALPILLTSLLTSDACTYRNVPNVVDVRTTLKLLRGLGADVETPEPGVVHVCSANLDKFEAPYDLVKTMRASFLVLGPLLARNKSARVSTPGGCAIGGRPIDLHIDGLRQLGADVELVEGYAQATVDELCGTRIYLDFPSVGATEHLMMVAALAKGQTIIEQAAREPEIIDLAAALNGMGASIEGAGEDQITIDGVEALRGANHDVIPDRIEAGTFMLAAAMTRGDVEVIGARADHLDPLALKMRQMGAEVTPLEGGLRVVGPERLQAVDVKTMPYPGFPTDLQAQMMAALCVADGHSVIAETIFENRFMHVYELMRMGADIKVEGHNAFIRGVEKLGGAPVMATDLRASVCLILAGLAADGITDLSRVYHLDRGYVEIEKKLSALGAEISRERE